MTLQKIILLFATAVIMFALFSAAQYYQASETVPTEEAREFVIRGQFIISLAYDQYNADPTTYNKDAISIMVLDYILILDALCDDPGIKYSCNEGYTLLEKIGSDLWGRDSTNG